MNRRKFGRALGAATLTPLAHSSAAQSTASGLTATARIRIHRPPAEVFAAFANADAMSKFWFTRRDDGLRAGEMSTWFLGSGEDAYSFEIRVRELSPPDRIAIDWENGGEFTRVTWSISDAGAGDSILQIEESGFTGDRDAVVARVLDSTGGFNQVVVAAKAWIEHGIAMNLVADHV